MRPVTSTCSPATVPSRPTLTAAGFPSRGDFGNSLPQAHPERPHARGDGLFRHVQRRRRVRRRPDLGSGGIAAAAGCDRCQRCRAAPGGGRGQGRQPVRGRPRRDGQVQRREQQHLAGAGAACSPAASGRRRRSSTARSTTGRTTARAGIQPREGAFSATPSSRARKLPLSGHSPSISANGTANGSSGRTRTAAARCCTRTRPATSARSCTTARRPPARDQFGAGNKFITPMVADGKVFVGTPGGVAVFGLLN